MRRIVELDSVRAIAALSVLIYHLRPKDYPVGKANLGWVGVNLFMLLSGFLITRIILDGGRDWRFLRAFYVRRGLRIWPIYYLTLFFFVAINGLLPHPFTLKNIPAYLVFLQNRLLAEPYVWPFNTALEHTWSLAIEEQFYVIWPPLLCLIGGRAVVKAAVVIVILSIVAKAQWWHPWLLASRMDTFALGGILAAWYDRWAMTVRSQRGPTIVFALIAFASVAVVAPFFGKTLTGDVTAMNFVLFSALGLVLTHQGSRWLAPLRWGLLCYLGTISYGLYLYHYCVNWFYGGFHVPFYQPPLVDMAKLATTLAIAYLSYEYIELPFLSLKGVVSYRQAGAPSIGESRGWIEEWLRAAWVWFRRELRYGSSTAPASPGIAGDNPRPSRTLTPE